MCKRLAGLRSNQWHIDTLNRTMGLAISICQWDNMLGLKHSAPRRALIEKKQVALPLDLAPLSHKILNALVVCKRKQGWG
jgi:hypothetical protein